MCFFLKKNLSDSEAEYKKLKEDVRKRTKYLEKEMRKDLKRSPVGLTLNIFLETLVQRLLKESQKNSALKKFCDLKKKLLKHW